VYHGNVGAAKLANWAPIGSEPIVNRPIELIRRSSFPVNTMPATFPTEPRRGCRSSGITPNWEGANIGQHSVTYPMARSAPVRTRLLSRRLGSAAGSATILCLYRGEADKLWLARLPSNWHAADAVVALNDDGALRDWGRLVALYPAW
jgi:hypothetical protein